MATFMIIYPLDFVRTRLAIDLGKDRKVCIAFLRGLIIFLLFSRQSSTMKIFADERER